jgi:hypothetical protein
MGRRGLSGPTLKKRRRKKSRQRPTLPPGCPGSTIGAGRLNGRVRNGNGCDTSAKVTGKNVSCKQPDSRAALEAIRSRKLKFSLHQQYKRYGQASRPISTCQLNVCACARRLHLKPINLVVFQGSLGRLPCGRSHLGVGFTLRCFQRLSLPNVATQRCHWRDNWCTRGSSIPVLSY